MVRPRRRPLYKLDKSGYEALAETLISTLLEQSNLETDTTFSFVRYHVECLQVHGRERTGCVSQNFLKAGQSLITVNRLLSNHLGVPLKQKLLQLPSDKRRVAYLADATADYTGLTELSRYLTLLFELDALFCNDDRHLNNIAVIEEGGRYAYCPIFDNAAGLLSDVRMSRMGIAPGALIAALRARPLNTTFTRQRNAARALYGSQLIIPQFTAKEIQEATEPVLEYYAQRDRSLILDRVTECILLQQKR